MTWPKALPSARNQWNQWTYACAPCGNWGAGHALLAMDNGDLYMILRRWYQYQYDESDMFVNLVARVTPDGLERISPDLTRYSAEGLNYGDINEIAPFDLPSWSGTGDIRATPWATFGDLHAVTDGRRIFALDMDVGRMMMIDTFTYEFTHVAGVYNASTPSDNFVGVDAGLPDVMTMTYSDGYVWFPSYGRYASNDRYGQLRRMSTTPPYAVSTVLDWAHPSGFPDGTVVENSAWKVATNPVTGLPNYFNPDALDWQTDTAIEFWEGDLYYYTSLTPGASLNLSEFGRIDMDTGLKQVLIYGLEDPVPNTPVRDRTSNHESTPLGVLVNGNENNFVPGSGTWFYEEMDLGSRSTILGDYFVTPNYAMAAFLSGYQIIGTGIATIHLPSLLTAVAENGGNPIRHDRRNPFWNTVANGTAADEQPGAGWSSAMRQRYWLQRDGSVPLLTHPLWGSTLTVGKAGPLQGRLVYMMSALPYMVRGSDNNNAYIVKVLDPPGVGSQDRMRVTVTFEGTHLKGYGPAKGLQFEHPTEVTLA